MSTQMAEYFVTVILLCSIITGHVAQMYRGCSKYDRRRIKCPELTLQHGIVCYTWRRSMVFGWLWSEATFLCDSSYRLRGKHTMNCRFTDGLFSRRNWYWDKGKPTCERSTTEFMMAPVMRTAIQSSFVSQNVLISNSTSSKPSTLYTTKASAETKSTVSPSVDPNFRNSTTSATTRDPQTATSVTATSVTATSVTNALVFTSEIVTVPRSHEGFKDTSADDYVFLTLLCITVPAAVAIILTVVVVLCLIHSGRRLNIKPHKTMFWTASDDEDDAYTITSVTNPNYSAHPPKN